MVFCLWVLYEFGVVYFIWGGGWSLVGMGRGIVFNRY